MPWWPGLIGLGARRLRVIPGEGLDPYAVPMNGPQGNELRVA
ncbi:MAG TPA: hypothetical protein VFC19_19000 [Candidatus Limnocylindrales bacterium]|nr:hypothetical protein [Candidatus Limnocylindrales bacterium]